MIANFENINIAGKVKEEKLKSIKDLLSKNEKCMMSPEQSMLMSCIQTLEKSNSQSIVTMPKAIPADSENRSCRSQMASVDNLHTP